MTRYVHSAPTAPLEGDAAGADLAFAARSADLWTVLPLPSPMSLFVVERLLLRAEGASHRARSRRSAAA